MFIAGVSTGIVVVLFVMEAGTEKCFYQQCVYSTPCIGRYPRFLFDAISSIDAASKASQKSRTNCTEKTIIALRSAQCTHLEVGLTWHRFPLSI